MEKRSKKKCDYLKNKRLRKNKQVVKSKLKIHPNLAFSKHLPSHRVTLETGLYKKGKISDVASRVNLSPESRARSDENLNNVLRLVNKHQQKATNVPLKNCGTQQGNEIHQHEDKQARCNECRREDDLHSNSSSGNTLLNMYDQRSDDIPHSVARKNSEVKENFRETFYATFVGSVSDAFSKFQKSSKQPSSLLLEKNMFDKKLRPTLLSYSFGVPSTFGQTETNMSPSSDEDEPFELHVCTDLKQKHPKSGLDCLDLGKNSPKQTKGNFFNPKVNPFQEAIREEYLKWWDDIFDDTPNCIETAVPVTRKEVNQPDEDHMKYHIDPLVKPPLVTDVPLTYYRHLMY